jgi:tetratricopeptide (TPR) repeat protein
VDGPVGRTPADNKENFERQEVLMKARRLLFTFAVTGLLGAFVLCTTVLAQTADQTPATQTGQKNWKDRAEYDLYDAITKDTNPKTRLDKLNQWKEKYPTTDYSDARQTLFITTYAQLGQLQDALKSANEALSKDPKDFTAIYYTAFLMPNLTTVTKQPPTPEQLDAAEKAANAILGGAKPANVSDADWQKAKGDVEAIAHKTLGWVAMQRKQPDTAEAEFKKSLTSNPKSGEVPYWLGIVILQERKPEKQSEALYYYARAAAYDGDGALAPDGRAVVNQQLKDLYTRYHGGVDGLDQLLAQAKSSPNPPDNFKIVSVVDKQKADLEKQAAEAAAHPDLALWKGIKDALTAPDGATYFEKMKGSLVPGGAQGVQKFTGKVISMEPAVKPKTVVIGIENGTVPDATLKFATPLPGKVDPGTTLSFSGVAESYTPNPFMVVFTVEKKDLEGWTGTNPAPARRPARRPVRK